MSNKSLHTQDEFEKMAQDYTSGVTLATLATQWAVTVPTMAKYVKKGGATLRRRGQRRKGITTTVTVSPINVEPTTDAIAEAPVMVSRQILSL